MSGYHVGGTGWTPAELSGRPLFFLSYARSDDDPHVEQFFRDLCGEVRVMAGLASTAQVGFFDTHSIEIGASWPAELVRAVAECSTFLALCSPRYFASEACGQEWALFTRRVLQYERTSGTTATCLFPVLWLPPRAGYRTAPEAVRRLHHTNDGLGETYLRDGLRQLIRLRRNRDEYLATLTVLAERIVENAATHPLPPLANHKEIDFSAVENPFRAPRQRRETTPSGAPALPAAPAEHVQFVVAAPDRSTARTVRRDLRFYGDEPVDWAPYLPESPLPLAVSARQVAAQRGLVSDVAPISGTEPTGAGTGEGIVVLLVDPWAPQIDEYHRALTAYERLPVPPAAAVVPRNPSDHETSEHWRRLTDRLCEVFVGRAGVGEPSAYRSEVISHRAFNDDLESVLEWARNQLFARSGRRGGPTPAPTRPILEGP